MGREQPRFTHQGGGTVLAVVTAILLSALIVAAFLRTCRTSVERQEHDVSVADAHQSRESNHAPVAHRPARGQTYEEYRESPDKRLERIQRAWPGLSNEEALALMAESDRIRADLDARGIPDPALQLRSEWHEIEVDEIEAREYFEHHREAFGERSFVDARPEIEEILGLRALRRRYAAGGDLVILTNDEEGKNW